MSKYIYPLTEEAAFEVASNLLPEDRREVEEGHGYDPMVIIPSACQDASSVYFRMPDGSIAGIGGVQDNGQIWMLCTPAIHKYPILFARECRRIIDSRKEKLLWNMVDKRNKTHIKLLKFLGFKFLREVKHGPNQLTFIEFCRVFRSPSKSSK